MQLGVDTASNILKEFWPDVSQRFSQDPFSRINALGHTIASRSSMRISTPRFWKAALLAAALVIPTIMAPAALRAEDHRTRYHDKGHNDDHEWNNHEDRAYRVWTRENHRRYRGFSRLKDDDREAYWGWRHEHSDALLKIDIR
jgi:hypothetical protein